MSQSLSLALVRWQGNYKGVDATWLRWANLEGELLPTPQEMVDEERQNADQARQQADQAQQRADQAESQLREVAVNLLQGGMSLEQVARLTGLAESEIEKLSN